MTIERIHTYRDSRFSQTVLNQHGAFLVDGDPCEVEIISDFEAVIRGCCPGNWADLIEEFRFYTPHITRFLTENGEIAAEFPRQTVFTLSLDEIQPSQFYVDEDKIAAVGTFLTKAEDVIIQVTSRNGRYLSMDGHTRLYCAVTRGWTQVRAVEATGDPCIFEFAEEAKKRGITTPKDLIPLPHAEYEEKWNRYCDAFFAAKEENHGN